MKLIGLGGGETTHSGYCILAQNIINEKIYFALWLWFVFLFVAGTFQMLLEMCTVVLPSFRLTLMTWQMESTLESHMKDYLQSCNLGTWFFLYQTGKNTDKRFFYEFVKMIARTSNSNAQDVEAKTQPLQEDKRKSLEMVKK